MQETSHILVRESYERSGEGMLRGRGSGEGTGGKQGGMVGRGVKVLKMALIIASTQTKCPR